MSAALRLRREPLAAAGAALAGGVLGLAVARKPLIAVALVLAAVAIVVVVTRPTLMLLVMIAALPWENKLHYPSATFSAVKGIGALVLLAYVVRLVGGRRAQIRLSGLHAIVAALGTWILLSLTFSTEPAGGLSKVVRWVLFLTFFFLLTQLVNGRAEIRRALRWFVGSVAAAAAYGLWLFVLHHTHLRVSGPLEDPNDFAYLLACALPLSAYLVAAERRWRAVWALCFLVIAAAMLGTFSRGALVGIGAVLVWAILTRRIPVWVVVSGLAAALVVAALAFTVWKPLVSRALNQKTHIAQRNTEAREVYWGAALTLAIRRPLTGVGPGRYPHEARPLLGGSPIALREPVTHNSYLEILAENGFPALLLFATYLAAVWLALRGVQRRAPRAPGADEQRLALALQAALIIAAVSGLFLSEELTAPFWLLGALAVVLLREGPSEPPPGHGAGGAAGAPRAVAAAAG